MVKRAAKMCNLFCNIAANELKSNVARFNTHIRTCLATNQVVADI